MGEIALVFSPISTYTLGEIMSKVSAERSKCVADEVHIWNLIIKHSCIYPSQELTKIDMHIKLEEAKDLCEALQEVLKVQAQGRERDKSLSQAETSTP